MGRQLQAYGSEITLIRWPWQSTVPRLLRRFCRDAERQAAIVVDVTPARKRLILIGLCVAACGGNTENVGAMGIGGSTSVATGVTVT